MGQWQDIVDSLSYAVIAISSDLRPKTANPAADSLLGVAAVTPAVLSDLLRSNEWLMRMIQNCLASGQSVGEPEDRLVVGHREMAVSAEVSPLMTRKARTDGVILVLQDLSLRKGAERTNPRKEQGLGLSSAGLAHEVKNPLTGIKGAAELLAAISHDGRAQQYCKVILDGADRIAGLVEQVLAASTPPRLNRTPVNIHQVLHQALAMAGLYPMARAGIDVEQQFDPSLPEIMGDPVALERVFVNLIKNATESIFSTGTITVRTRMEGEFRLRSGGRDRQLIRIEVSDSGRGMTDGELAQLFTPFFTTKPNGTGLGLVVSQRIIVAHGGHLRVQRRDFGVDVASQSAMNSGMTFIVTLPLDAIGSENVESEH